MNNLLKTALLLSVFLGWHTAFGQRYLDILSVRYQLAPPFGYKDMDGRTQTSRVQFALQLPIQLKNGGALIFGADGQRLAIQHDLEDFKGTSRFGNGALQLGYFKPVGEKWAVTSLVMPRISSDFKDFTLEDFQIGAMFVARKKVSETFKYSLGLYYNSEYFATFLVPLVGIDWQLSPKWRAFGIIPSVTSIQYQVSERFALGGKYFAPTQSFRLSPNASLDAPYKGGYMHESHFGVWNLYAEAFVTKEIAVALNVGYTLVRNYRVFADGDRQALNMWGLAFGKRSEVQPLQYMKPKDGLHFEVGVYYRYDLEKPAAKP